MWLVAILGFAALIGLVVLIAKHSEEQQRRLLAERLAIGERLASEWGMSFVPEFEAPVKQGFWASLFGTRDTARTDAFIANFEGFTPFGTGHTMSAKNIVSGREDDLEWMAFDFLYHTTHSTGKSTVTIPHPTGVLGVRLPVSMSDCTIGPEGFFARLANALGAPEVDFEFEEFNKRYSVRCKEKQFAYDLLHSKAIEFLMSMDPISWQIRGNMIMLVNDGYYTYEEVSQARAHLQQFVELLPTYLRKDRKVEIEADIVQRINS